MSDNYSILKKIGSAACDRCKNKCKDQLLSHTPYTWGSGPTYFVWLYMCERDKKWLDPDTLTYSLTKIQSQAKMRSFYASLFTANDIILINTFEEH